MLDIDLEFLKFALNPSLEYIKDDIEVIKKSYLKDTKDSELSKKEDNFNRVNYLFLTDIDTLSIFLTKFYKKLIKDVYIKFGNFFSINLEGELIDNNFISNILLKNNIKNLDDDIDLNIFKTEITKYLVNIVKNSNTEKDKILAKKALIYIDELLEKKNEFDKILIPNINLVKEKLNKRKQIKDSFIKKIIREHVYLLSDEAKNIIYSNDDFDYHKLLENEDTFNQLFTFNTENTANNHIILKEIELSKELKQLNNIILDPNFIYISDNTPYKEYYALIKIIKDQNKYNELYQKSISDLIFTNSKDEIMKKVENFIKKDNLNELYSLNLFEDTVFNQNIYNCFDTSLNLIILSPLSWIRIYKNKIFSEFYHSLIHELGHVFDLEKTNYQIQKNIFKTDNYKLLYEIYNEYRAKNKANELIWNNCFFKKGFIHYEGLSIYQTYFGFLIDFFDSFNKEFLEYIDTDNIKILENIIGEKNFSDMINLINNFDYKCFNEDFEYANKIFESFNKYLEVKEDKKLCMEKK